MDTFSLSHIASLTVTVTALFFFRLATAMDSLAPSQSLGDANTLVSKEGTFEMGFFSPGISKNRYLGIWYKNVQEPTYVWVANRNNPINDSSGILVINTTGHITLVSHNNTSVVWSARLLRSKVSNPKLQLLDTGNLVLIGEEDEDSDNFSWQSFDYPTDTLLPGMKLGWDLKNKIERYLTSWKNPYDPSNGDLTLKLEHLNFPEPIIWKGSDQEYVRFGPWNGLAAFPLDPVRNSLNTSGLSFKFIDNEDEISYQYSVQNKSILTMAKLSNQSTDTFSFYWIRPFSTGNWIPLPEFTAEEYCHQYGVCGPNGYCDSSRYRYCLSSKGFQPFNPLVRSIEDYRDDCKRRYRNCSCLEGFKPITNSEGCEHNKPLDCSDEVGFANVSRVKLPDTRRTWVNRSMNLEECRETCLRNCSCMAFANTDIRGSGTGCAIWMGDLIDLKYLPDGGQDLYVRVLASELVEKSWHESTYKAPAPHNIDIGPYLKITLLGMAMGLTIVILCVIGNYSLKKNKSRYEDSIETIEPKDLELPMFELYLINNATNNFSLDNKLGEGGFGPVYKGKLANGQDIAVKRLSRSSGQGMNEFKNEVILIAKLQHRNLVKLLGCCIEGEEKMLIYEYMPNKSLDFFIFDKTRRQLLHWSKRYEIICGIARGIVYLHQDSRLRIIHRDLKASNILLDADMNPKISDFGLAKTCFDDQTEGNTRRIVGTYGYMAPEYAFEGKFSIKSDVFSYGILLLEIISGKRSRGFRHVTDQNIISYAWRLWEEGNPEELIDETIKESCNFCEMLRCVHISLLCIQQHPNNRPTMSSVVMMIGSENPLPQPKQPSFYLEHEATIMDCDSNKRKSSSINELTVTLPELR